ncbi:hypothetical protein OG977_09925 [Kitasatospora purpeofusca]
MGKSGLLAQFVEASADRRGVEGLAVGVLEDVVVVGGGVPGDGALECCGDALGQGCPVAALLRFRRCQDEFVVVDRGERVADEHDAVVDPYARALEAEGLALAQAGADDDLDDIGGGGVFGAAVGEEGDGLLGAPGDAFVGAGSADRHGPGGVERQAVGAHC